MSESFKKIISENPYSVTLSDRFDEIIGFMKNRCDIKDASLEIGETVEFIDCGENLEDISCPNCGEKIDFEWWGEAVERCFENNFFDLTVEVPCCGGKCSLNDLKYNMPCGFAKAAVVIDNENVDDTALVDLSELLGEKLKVIRIRY